MTFVLDGKTFETNEDGYLTNPSDWSIKIDAIKPTKNGVEAVCSFLRARFAGSHVACEMYHGGMGGAERSRVHRGFLSGAVYSDGSVRCWVLERWTSADAVPPMRKRAPERRNRRCWSQAGTRR